MTYTDVMEAIASKIAALWPGRMIYRDFCPVDHKRPSCFLYVHEAGWTDANLGLVEWTFQAQLELFAETDEYDAESTEALRADQAAVLALFGGPSLAVGDRHIILTAAAETPGPGVAYVSFTASWLDRRPGYQDPEAQTPGSGGAPLMEDFALHVSNRKD